MIANKLSLPSEYESTIARESMRLLSYFAQEDQPLTIQVIDEKRTDLIELPAGAVSLLMEILGAMAVGRGVTIIPVDAELTTVQSAEILNVSRPFLIKLLEQKKIPYRKVGKHRRIRMEDILNYRKVIDIEREKVLDQLAADAQAQGMGYE